MDTYFNNGFQSLTVEEMENIDGGLGFLAGCAIIAGSFAVGYAVGWIFG